MTLDPTIESQLMRWVTAQLVYWEGQDYLSFSFDSFLAELNESEKDIFVFQVDRGSVSLMPKPAFYTSEELNSDFDSFTWRANLYCHFLNEVTRSYVPHIECRFAMSMHDRAVDSSPLPLFAFQKPRGSHAVLLPDIDCLNHKFYEGGAIDVIDYDKKINKAVFVGSTTGKSITLETVKELSSERLRLANYFKNSSDVIFSLPNIVQCDNADTEAALRALGFGHASISWDEQRKFRFLISVDGNGATCSRVALALKSNSVLLKFDSNNVLYYFGGLEEYHHYIPIFDPSEVQAVISAEQKLPGLNFSIAKAGAEFFERYLARRPTMQYTALLLERYAALFWSKNEAVQLVGDASVAGECIAHIADHGDVHYQLDQWIGEFGGKCAIEGLEFSFTSGLQSKSIRSSILVEPNGTWIHGSGEFIGSRRRATPIVGIAFELIGTDKHQYDCEYFCNFSDGTVSRKRNGEVCVTAKFAALVAVRLVFGEKQKTDESL